MQPDGSTGGPGFTDRTTCAATLAAGASCTVTLTFKPTALVPYSATLNMTESSGAVDTVSLSVKS